MVNVVGKDRTEFSWMMIYSLEKDCPEVATNDVNSTLGKFIIVNLIHLIFN